MFCTDRERLNEFMEAASNKDMAWRAQLAECSTLSAGTKVAVIEESEGGAGYFVGKVLKVRTFSPDQKRSQIGYVPAFFLGSDKP
jgi:hypothetical protein